MISRSLKENVWKVLNYIKVNNLLGSTLISEKQSFHHASKIDYKSRKFTDANREWNMLGFIAEIDSNINKEENTLS